MRVRLTAAAVGDIEQARDWYEKRRPGVGVTFITRVDEAIQSIAANPRAYQEIHRDVRRARLRRFPYGLYYRVEVDESVILACLHFRRDPSLVAARAIIQRAADG